ncbi:MAG TPA: FAD-binding domain-containing protein [Pseudomonadales bacterium]|nr:FAD-binding domain-containing protein [Pseudomonadales bacterium]
MSDIQLVWFRSDLRTVDQIALAEAARCGPVVAVHCLCPAQLRAHDVGANRIAFVLRCLGALATELDALGIPLRHLDAADFAAVPAALLALAREVGAGALWFNDEHPIDEVRRDAAVVRTFEAAGLAVHRRCDDLIRAPGSVTTKTGDPYMVFTPFRRSWLADLDLAAARPRARPAAQTRPQLASDPLPAMPAGLSSAVDPELWPGGERAAQARLEAFVDGVEGAEDGRIDAYARDRDLPARAGTSSLSAYLSVGAISPRTCMDAVLEANEGRLDTGSEGAVTWMTELIWREFYRHVVAAWPHVSRGHCFRREYDSLRWRDDPEALAAWQEGRTGFPLIDAAMRQLATTGWMHNRLRMVVAMFLSKNLLLDWRLGERHFMDQLVDGDFASNNGGWQWSASTGTDAAPYFRVFSPVSQSQRFDPEARFIRHWLPELADVELRRIHDPSIAGGIPDYPPPIVDAKASRQRAIDAFRAHGDR